LKWIPKQMACFFLSTTHSASGISILTGCKWSRSHLEAQIWVQSC
jgi:hypothetical protein